jgi:mannose-1-phosphate guanylyltransferase
MSGKHSALILAGGRGERFWPWSRPERPKQLLPLVGGRSLLETTLDRSADVVPPAATWVLTSEALVPAVRALVPKGVHVVGEPVGRNTAPAIAAGALLAQLAGYDGGMAVLPADHWIEPMDAFGQTLQRALALADRDDVLVTIGIPPARPETGYGYVERGDPLAEPDAYRVASFREKPNLETAEEFLAAGRFYWNSGMFFWRPAVLWEAMRAHRPGVAQALAPLAAAKSEAEFMARWADAFAAVESISVDYAVMEHATNAVVLPAKFTWDDLGSWNAWARLQGEDANGNVVHGNAVLEDVEGCIVVAEDEPVAVLGLRDAIVVQRDGATLVCPRDRSEEVRRLVQAVEGKARQ